jgi:hypothetical protein
MAEEQLRQDRAERRSAIEKGPEITAEQCFVKEATAEVNKLREQLEDKVRNTPAAAEGQEQAAQRTVTARRKAAAALATKWANRLQVAAKVKIKQFCLKIRGDMGRENWQKFTNRR